MKIVMVFIGDMVVMVPVVVMVVIADMVVISRHLQLGPHGAESPAQTSTHYFTCCNVYKPITGKVIHIINTKYHTSTTILILEIFCLWVG